MLEIVRRKCGSPQFRLREFSRASPAWVDSGAQASFGSRVGLSWCTFASGGSEWALEASHWSRHRTFGWAVATGVFGAEVLARPTRVGSVCAGFVPFGLYCKAVLLAEWALACVSIRVPATLTKWVQPARLVTRTKESDMCASFRVSNPRAQ